MYKAKKSFATKDYNVHGKQKLSEDFTNQEEIDEFLDIEYIETYDGSLEITENGSYDVTEYETAEVNVSGGGTTIPTNLTEYNQQLVDLRTSYYNYLKNVSNSYPTYTNNAVTLHTPNIDYKNYIIQKRNGNRYRVVWFAFDFALCDSSTITRCKWQFNNNEISDLDKYSGIFATNSIRDNFYTSEELSTLNECVEKFLNNELTYSQVTGNALGYVQDTPYKIPYSNTAIIFQATGETLEAQRISKNETVAES